MKVQSWAHEWPSPKPVEITAEAKHDRISMNGVRVAQDCARGNIARERQVRVTCALAHMGIEVRLPVVIQVPGHAQTDCDLASLVSVLEFCKLPDGAKLDPERLAETAFIGQLSLSGDLCPARGIVGILEAAAAAGVKRAIVPATNRAEAADVPGIEVLMAHHARDVVGYLYRGAELAAPWANPPEKPEQPSALYDPDCESAAQLLATGQGVLWRGPKGLMDVARRARSVMAPLTPAQLLEVRRTFSATGIGDFRERPLRAPHHSVSERGMLGDQRYAGELQLARHGILVLQDLHEFSGAVLDRLTRATLQGIAVIAHLPDAKEPTRAPVTRFLERVTLLERTTKWKPSEHCYC